MITRIVLPETSNVEKKRRAIIEALAKFQFDIGDEHDEEMTAFIQRTRFLQVLVRAQE